MGIHLGTRSSLPRRAGGTIRSLRSQTPPPARRSARRCLGSPRGQARPQRAPQPDGGARALGRLVRQGGPGSPRPLSSVKNPVRWENAVFCQEPAHLRKPHAKKRAICERRVPTGRRRASVDTEIVMILTVVYLLDSHIGAFLTKIQVFPPDRIFDRCRLACLRPGVRQATREGGRSRTGRPEAATSAGPSGWRDL